MKGYLTTEGGGGGNTLVLPTRQVEVDFGPLPKSDGLFTVNDPDVTPTSRILAQIALEPGTGKDEDEVEMEQCLVEVAAKDIVSGQFMLFIRDVDGSYLHDKFKVNYQVSF